MVPEAPQKRVLVADDEEQLLRLCGRVLGRSGYEVLAARNGDDLTRLFAAHRDEIGAVVVDATLPPGGAAAALETIWKLCDDVGVVLTSGADLDGELRALLAASDGVFLRKPFAAAALVRAVADVQSGPEA
jgi:two-component system cell cycle sensor histidine kinase/response regulator CckA